MLIDKLGRSRSRQTVCKRICLRDRIRKIRELGRREVRNDARIRHHCVASVDLADQVVSRILPSGVIRRDVHCVERHIAGHSIGVRKCRCRLAVRLTELVELILDTRCRIRVVQRQRAAHVRIVRLAREVAAVCNAEGVRRTAHCINHRDRVCLLVAQHEIIAVLRLEAEVSVKARCS